MSAFLNKAKEEEDKLPSRHMTYIYIIVCYSFKKYTYVYITVSPYEICIIVLPNHPKIYFIALDIFDIHNDGPRFIVPP